LFIRGIGAYLPGRVDAQWAVRQGLYPAEEAATSELTGALVAGDMPAPEMALHAARDAVKRAGQHPEDLDLLLYVDTWLQGPEGWLPCTYLQHHLTGGGVPAFEMRQGCGGMFVAMELAAGYLAADPARSAALLVSADNYGTPLVDRWTAGPYILGDAATAMVLSKEEGFARVCSVHSATVLEEAELNRGGQPIFPPAVTIGAPVKFNARFIGNGSQPPGYRAELAARMIRLHAQFQELVDATMAEAGVTAADITRLATINTRREVVTNRGMDTLGVDLAKSTWDYGRTIGHCGASDQLLSFEHLLSSGELRPGDHLMMLATGPGIMLHCAIIEILRPPPWLG
jgi:3-oxoacyl-[acyl-carrier-protein] synthase-3/clorobiocin biosynthesis protein CloN2